MTITNPIISKIFPQQSAIHYVGRGDDRLSILLRYCKKPLEEIAKKHDIKLTVAQRDDLLLINSGAKTAAFNISEVETPADIIEKVYKNAVCNIK